MCLFSIQLLVSCVIIKRHYEVLYEALLIRNKIFSWKWILNPVDTSFAPSPYIIFKYLVIFKFPTLFKKN